MAVYCGKLMADMGADVIKVEPPGGDPMRGIGPFVDGQPGPGRSLYWLHFNTNKRSVTLDIGSPEGAALLRKLALRIRRAAGDLPALDVPQMPTDEDVRASLSDWANTHEEAKRNEMSLDVELVMCHGCELRAPFRDLFRDDTPLWNR